MFRIHPVITYDKRESGKCLHWSEIFRKTSALTDLLSDLPCVASPADYLLKGLVNNP